ncbi:KH domain-containing protein [Kamptonema formosum]|uniref:KH domain-containing protein n=1 Tax=Kamptonema formosum TaxID=331992 RepID=UPI0008FBF962|nr:KH domain-containing protein [Oscillatoria sp. PCC 10802]
MADLSANFESPPASAGADYAGLVRFLVEPFLDSPDSLKVDCEMSPSRPKVWLRVALEGEDKGRVFGRGGRNIQAIRTVLEASARTLGQSVYLDIYGGAAGARDIPPPSRPPAPRGPKPQARRSSAPRSSSSRSRPHGSS